MRRNIYIIGAQSTGKTTLVKALEAHFTSLGTKPSIICEVARGVLKKHQYTAHDIVDSPQRSLDLQRLIIEAQAVAEREIEGKTAGVVTPKAAVGPTTLTPYFISDRSAIDPIVYARQYVGLEESRTLMGMKEWRQMLARMSGSLIVVCTADVSWLREDGVRLMPSNVVEWLQTSKLCCEVLCEASLSYVVLPKDVMDINDRVAFVLNHL